MSRWYHWAMLALTFLAVAGAAISIALQVRAKKPEITAQITAIEDLASPKNVPDLIVTSTYKGQAVERLWKINMTFINSGSKTIVAQGTQSNVIGDGLNFAFPSSTALLSTPEIISKDFDVSVTMGGQNNFGLHFQQWRSGEKIIVAIHVTAGASTNSAPKPQAVGRALVDGDVMVKDIQSLSIVPKQPFLDTLAPAISVPLRVVGFVVCLVVGGLLLMVGYFGLRDAVVFLIWHQKFAVRFSAFVRSRFPDPRLVDMYLAQPTRLSDDHWKAFQGKKLSLIGPAETVREGLVLFVGMTTFGLATLAFLLSPLIRV